MGGDSIIGLSTSDLSISEDEEMGDYFDAEGKEYDISDSEMKQYKEAVHKLLKFRTFKIRGPNGELRCPFCVGVEKHEYHRLLEHAVRLAEGSTESGKQRANHSAMAKYLVIDLASEAKQSTRLDVALTEEKRKMDLRNNRMAAEKLKENEVALSNQEDTCRHSILKEQHSNEELEEVRVELIKKDLRNNEMAEKLREAEENYGGLVKRLESSLTASDEKNSLLESELAQAKENASSTIAKQQEVEKTCLQLRQNLQSLEEKLSNLEDENQVLRQKTLNMDLRNNQLAEKLKEATESFRLLDEKLKEKEIALSNLVFKEQQSNDELEEVRKELIKLLSDLTSRGHFDYSFGVKGKGEIDQKALKDACKKRFPFSNAEHKLIELNIRQCELEIIVDDKGNPQGLLMNSDKKLPGIRDEFGEEIYGLLVASLIDRQKYRRSGIYMDSELWNFGANRKATLEEVIRYVSSLLKTQNAETERCTGKKWRGGGAWG